LPLIDCEKMAAKAKENRAQRDWLKTQMFEIWEVVKSSPEEVEEPSLRIACLVLSTVLPDPSSDISVDQLGTFR
jgi:hypothetical protein